MKQLKIDTPQNDFKLSIVELISQGSNPAKIAQLLNWSEQRLSYYLRQLKQEGVIKKIGYGTWQTTKKELKKKPRVAQEGLIFSSPKEVRGHAFQIKIIIPKLKNWEKREAYLKRHKIPYEQRTGYQSLMYKGVKIWLCEKAIIFYLPKSYYGKTSGESYSFMVYDFYSLVQSLESLLNVNLRIKGNYQFTVKRNHYSLIKNEIAKDHLESKDKLHVWIDGRLIYLVDNSENLMEFEAVNPGTAKRDIEPVQKLLIDIRKNPDYFKPSEVTSIIQRLAQENLLLARNVREHLNLVNEIKGYFKKMNGGKP